MVKGKSDIMPAIKSFNPATDVNTTTDIITIINHGFNSLDGVIYKNGTGQSVGGLVDSTKYYVIVIDNDNLKLGADEVSARNSIAVDLISTGSGTVHTLEFTTIYPKETSIHNIFQNVRLTGGGLAGDGETLTAETVNDTINIVGGAGVSFTSINNDSKSFTFNSTQYDFEVPTGTTNLRLFSDSGDDQSIILTPARGIAITRIGSQEIEFESFGVTETDTLQSISQRGNITNEKLIMDNLLVAKVESTPGVDGVVNYNSTGTTGTAIALTGNGTLEQPLLLSPDYFTSTEAAKDVYVNFQSPAAQGTLSYVAVYTSESTLTTGSVILQRNDGGGWVTIDNISGTVVDQSYEINGNYAEINPATIDYRLVFSWTGSTDIVTFRVRVTYEIENVPGTEIILTDTDTESLILGTLYGNVTIRGNVTLSDDISTDGIRIFNNNITSINSDDNIVLEPSGVGGIEIRTENMYNTEATFNLFPDTVTELNIGWRNYPGDSTVPDLNLNNTNIRTNLHVDGYLDIKNNGNEIAEITTSTMETAHIFTGATTIVIGNGTADINLGNIDINGNDIHTNDSSAINIVAPLTTSSDITVGNDLFVPHESWLHRVFIDNELRLNTDNVHLGNGSAEQGQDQYAVAIGSYAGQRNQSSSSVAIGNSAGQFDQGASAIAIGTVAGALYQGSQAVAIGTRAGSVGGTGIFQGPDAVAIGTDAGRVSQGTSSVAIGHYSGEVTQSDNSVAIGYAAGNLTQGTDSVAIGIQAGTSNQGNTAVAIGKQAGNSNQGDDSIAIGREAGFNQSDNYSVVIGAEAGRGGGEDSVRIGYRAGRSNSDQAVAVGHDATRQSGQLGTTSLGYKAGELNQGLFATAIGWMAGNDTQGQGAIAIGKSAGSINQHQYSLILNNSNTVLQSDGDGRVYIGSIRQTNGTTSSASGLRLMFYDNSNKEVSIGAPTSLVFNGSTIGTDDSSGIILDNVVTVNSDLNVDTDLIVGQNITAGGNVLITGDLTVQGTTVTLNTANLDVEDLNITVAKGATSSLEADGAGLTVDGAGTSFTYDASVDRWNLNKGLSVTGNGTFSNDLSALGAAVFGNINNTPIGNSTASSGAFTTLTASTSISISGPSTSVTIAPTTLSSMDNVAIGGTTPLTGAFTDLSASGFLTTAGVTEEITPLSGATGTVTHDLDNATVFYHTSPAADFTANFTNVPTTNNKAISVALTVVQGATAYYPSAVEIDGVSQTIKWAEGFTPTPNPNNVDVFTFTLFRVSSTWSVIGALSTYG